jgi:transcriptional regulator GlxA family with amidase domain
MTLERTDIAFRPAAQAHADTVSWPAEQPPSLIVPCGVKKAMTFLEANLGGTIRIADLCAAANLSPRTLFKQFSDFVGMSPMAWVRRRRLQRVRVTLESGGRDSVTVTALRWGLWHLGRFAGDYHREFGELPSETLRRARRRSITRL